MKNKAEIISYLVFGILTTLINIISYLFLTKWFGLDYPSATTSAWVISVLFAFITNKLYVFQSVGRDILSTLKEMGSFGLSRLLSYALDILTMILLIEVLHTDDLGAKIFANVLVVIFNYLAGKYFVFRQIAKE